MIKCISRMIKFDLKLSRMIKNDINHDQVYIKNDQVHQIAYQEISSASRGSSDKSSLLSYEILI